MIGCSGLDGEVGCTNICCQFCVSEAVCRYCYRLYGDKPGCPCLQDQKGQIMLEHVTVTHTNTRHSGLLPLLLKLHQ